MDGVNAEFSMPPFRNDKSQLANSSPELTQSASKEIVWKLSSDIIVILVKGCRRCRQGEFNFNDWEFKYSRQDILIVCTGMPLLRGKSIVIPNLGSRTMSFSCIVLSGSSSLRPGYTRLSSASVQQGSNSVYD